MNYSLLLPNEIDRFKKYLGNGRNKKTAAQRLYFMLKNASACSAPLFVFPTCTDYNAWLQALILT